MITINPKKWKILVKNDSLVKLINIFYRGSVSSHLLCWWKIATHTWPRLWFNISFNGKICGKTFPSFSPLTSPEGIIAFWSAIIFHIHITVFVTLYQNHLRQKKSFKIWKWWLMFKNKSLLDFLYAGEKTMEKPNFLYFILFYWLCYVYSVIWVNRLDIDMMVMC